MPVHINNAIPKESHIIGFQNTCFWRNLKIIAAVVGVSLVWGIQKITSSRNSYLTECECTITQPISVTAQVLFIASKMSPLSGIGQYP